MYLVIGIVLAFILSFWKDNRSLWNPVLFLLSLISSYIYLSYLFYKNGYENVQLAFYGVAFVLLPLLLFLSGIFLIYNGVILLKREGRSKANYLSMLLGIVILLFFALISFRLGGSKCIILHQSFSKHFICIHCLFLFYFWLCLCGFHVVLYLVSLYS